MSEEEYIEKRIKEQMKWYDDKSIQYKKYYYRLMKASIIISAMIPVSSILIEYCRGLNIVVALMGATVSIISGIVSLSQYYNNWIKYRMTSEQLEHNLFLYQTNAKPFNEENRFEILVEITENIIMKNNYNWYEVQSELNDSHQTNTDNLGR